MSIRIQSFLDSTEVITKVYRDVSMGADLATSFDNPSDVCPLENYIIDAKLQHMAGTSHRLQMSWQVGGEL